MPAIRNSVLIRYRNKTDGLCAIMASDYTIKDNKAFPWYQSAFICKSVEAYRWVRLLLSSPKGHQNRSSSLEEIVTSASSPEADHDMFLAGNIVYSREVRYRSLGFKRSCHAEREVSCYQREPGGGFSSGHIRFIW